VIRVGVCDDDRRDGINTFGSKVFENVRSWSGVDERDFVAVNDYGASSVSYVEK
jgi:hypothetical protein